MWRQHRAAVTVELFFSSDGERQRDLFLFFPGTVVRCFRRGAEELLHLGDVEQPEGDSFPPPVEVGQVQAAKRAAGRPSRPKARLSAR